MNDGEKSLIERVSHLENLQKDQISTHQYHSVQFALILVANLMLLNGGALVAFPNFVKKLNENSQVTNLALHAAAAFVAGIVLAAICGYAAYWNFQAHAQLEANHRSKEIFDAKYPGADYNQPNLLSYSNEIAIIRKKWMSRINHTMLIGNLSGIGSLLVFVLGCYYSGLMVLS